MLNFLEAIDKDIKPVADIEQGHISTASCILANISMQLNGRALIYDPLKRMLLETQKQQSLLQKKIPWTMDASLPKMYDVNCEWLCNTLSIHH
jgi:hypothetical protein